MVPYFEKHPDGNQKILILSWETSCKKWWHAFGKQPRCNRSWQHMTLVYMCWRAFGAFVQRKPNDPDSVVGKGTAQIRDSCWDLCHHCHRSSIPGDHLDSAHSVAMSQLLVPTEQKSEKKDLRLAHRLAPACWHLSPRFYPDEGQQRQQQQVQHNQHHKEQRQ